MKEPFSDVKVVGKFDVEKFYQSLARIYNNRYQKDGIEVTVEVHYGEGIEPGNTVEWIKN